MHARDDAEPLAIDRLRKLPQIAMKPPIALGGGLEYSITQSLSAKLEYLYITAASLEVSRHGEEVRAGLNYRFGGV
jgi:hypothetical protein